MRISRETYNSMLKSVKDIPPESGGILGEKNGIIQFVIYDEGVKNEKMCSYTPNAEKLNLVIREWQEQGILFCGIFHTHFFGVKTFLFNAISISSSKLKLSKQVSLTNSSYFV